MKILIQIIDDKEEIIWEYEGPIENPQEMRTPPDRPFRCLKHFVYGFTYQPRVKAILGGE
jgi:hypothetical protein